MAYRKKTRARSSSYRRSGSARAARKTVRRTYSKRTKRAAPARKRYRKTVKPQTIRIELVQSAGSNLSPLEQQLASQREAVAPKKARF